MAIQIKVQSLVFIDLSCILFTSAWHYNILLIPELLISQSVVVISLRQHEDKTTAHNEDSQRFGSGSIRLVAGSSVDLLRELLSQDLVELCPTQMYGSSSYPF